MRENILVGAIALCVGVACAGDFPFIAVRNMGSGAANPQFTEAVFAANEKYPGLDLPDTVWAMTPDEKRHPGVFYPTSPEARELNLKSAKAVIGGLKPYAYWPDDDLRLSKRGNRICFCDRCVAVFNRRSGRNLTRVQLDAALYGKPGDKTVRADWIQWTPLHAEAQEKYAHWYKPELKI